MSQGTWVPLEAGKGQETDSLRASRRNASLIFTSQDPFQTPTSRTEDKKLTWL